MKKRIIAGILLCMFVIIFSIIPGALAITYDFDTHSDSRVLPLVRMIIRGFFPQVSGDEITYMAFPGFHWVTILKDEFTGYIGIFIIYGTLDGPY